jgi:hypothetical protein
MPMVRAFCEELVGHKGETGVVPMERVAKGAAIQAGVLAGEVRAIVLVEVTPHTLDIERLGGAATPLMARVSGQRSSRMDVRVRPPVPLQPENPNCRTGEGAWHADVNVMSTLTGTTLKARTTHGDK